MIYNSNEQLVAELKKLLLDTKCSQRDIAKQMGIPPQALQNLLNKKQLSLAGLKRTLLLCLTLSRMTSRVWLKKWQRHPEIYNPATIFLQSAVN